jgi:pSer/pThr/pTyr-binding forkhead associated (FHA) protein
MAFLYRIGSDGCPAECWTVEDTPLVVGQGDSAEARVEDDMLSHSHFLIAPEGHDFILVDLESRNGTWLNDQRVSAGKLGANTLIRAGQSLFCFSLTALPKSAQPVSVPPREATDANRTQPRAT